MAVRIRHADYPQKLAITSPTSGGRSVGIVRSRTQAMEFVCLFVVEYWNPFVFKLSLWMKRQPLKVRHAVPWFPWSYIRKRSLIISSWYNNPSGTFVSEYKPKEHQVNFHMASSNLVLLWQLDSAPWIRSRMQTAIHVATQHGSWTRNWIWVYDQMNPCNRSILSLSGAHVSNLPVILCEGEITIERVLWDRTCRVWIARTVITTSHWSYLSVTLCNCTVSTANYTRWECVNWYGNWKQTE
jgi:hypothetical protein